MTALEFAKANDYDIAKETGVEWHGYKVFDPDFTDGKTHCIGLPHSILVKDNEIRFTTPEECFEVFSLTHPKTEDEEEDDGIHAYENGLNLYKYSESDTIWWVETLDNEGEFLFTFDKKKVFNFFQDYPDKLTSEQVEIFKRENPTLAELKTTE